MKSILDRQEHFFDWHCEQAVLKNRQLWLFLIDVLESVFEAKAAEQPEDFARFAKDVIENNPLKIIDGRRVIVHFADVIYFHVYDEFARLDNDAEEEREEDIIALHKNSALIAWLKESTVLHQVRAGEFFHYSVLTASDYYHVITSEKPSIYEE